MTGSGLGLISMQERVKLKEGTSRSTLKLTAAQRCVSGRRPARMELSPQAQVLATMESQTLLEMLVRILFLDISRLGSFGTLNNLELDTISLG